MGGSRFLKRSLQQSAPSLEVYRGGLVVSFARHGRSHVQSFPRKRESTPPAIGNAPPTDWIPAFAGMTNVLRGIPSQMAPLPGRGAPLLLYLFQYPAQGDKRDRGLAK